MENKNGSSVVVSKKVLVPFLLVTSLFALWGFANAVTDPMVNAFKKVLELSNAQASWVQMAFYGGYFCMALPAALFMRKYSYKVGILIGLGLYSGGALLFYPAAVTGQFWFFCLALYVLTFGLSFLETAANPYVLAMGSKETATRRLNLAQSVNPLGLIMGLLTAKYLVYEQLLSDDYKESEFKVLDEFKRLSIKVEDLAVIREPYVILGLVIASVFVLFLVSKMPQSRQENLPNIKMAFGELLKNKKYILGVLALVLYVGAQIMSWTYIYQYAEGIDLSNAEVSGYQKIDVFSYQLVAFILFTVGRFIGTWMLRYTSAHKLLMYFAIAGAILTGGAVFIFGHVGLCCLVGVSFFLSLMFPTIYGIALKDLTEEQAKIGSAGLVMAIVGGALLPFLQGWVVDIEGRGVADIHVMGIPEINFSFILTLLCFMYIIWFSSNVPRLSKK